MKTLAVSGATGFIGRRLIVAALQGGWRVRALVRDSMQLRMNEARLSVARWDAAEQAPHDLLAGVDIVCHLAGFIPPNHADPASAELCFRVNVLGTLALLGAATAAGTPRFLHVSSANAYAPAPRPVDETCPLYPSDRAPYYLTSKLSSEIMVDHWRKTLGLDACILRLGSVYGPGMVSGGLLPTLASRLLAGQPVMVEDGGRHRADFVYVDDVVEAILAASISMLQGPVNIASGVATSSGELAGLLLALTAADPSLVTVKPPRDGRGATGFAGLCIDRAKAELAFRPTPLRDGMRLYLSSLSATETGAGS